MIARIRGVLDIIRGIAHALRDEFARLAADLRSGPSLRERLAEGATTGFRDTARAAPDGRSGMPSNTGTVRGVPTGSAVPPRPREPLAAPHWGAGPAGTPTT